MSTLSRRTVLTAVGGGAAAAVVRERAIDPTVGDPTRSISVRQGATGSYWGPSEAVVPQDFDLSAGGGETDALPAINQASLAASQGPGVVLFPRGTYLVGVGATAQLRPYDAVAWRGAGMGSTIIRVADTSGDYPAVICGTSGLFAPLTDFTVADLTIDQNAAGNASSNVTPAEVTKTLMAFSCGVGTRIAFDRVRFKDAVGVNTINVNAVGAVDLAVRQCVANWVQGATATPGYDNSFVYYYGERGVFTDNLIVSEVPERARCAFEVHGGGMVVAGNVVENFQTLANLTSGVFGQTSRGLVCTGNVVRGGNYGIAIAAGVTGTLDGVLVAGNTIDIRQAAWDENGHYGIAVLPGTDFTGVYDNIRVEDNAISFETGDARVVDRNGAVLSPYIGGIVALGHTAIRNSSFSRNLVRDAPALGVWIGETTVPTSFVNCRFDGNDIVDAGQNAAAPLRSAIVIQGNHVHTSVSRNRITDTGAAMLGHHWLLASTGNGLGTCVDLRVTDNDLWTQSGTAYLATVTTGKVTTLEETVLLDIPSVAANGGAQDLTVSVTGARTGDLATASPRSAFAAGLFWTVWVSRAETVTIRVLNVAGTELDPPPDLWDVRVHRKQA